MADPTSQNMVPQVVGASPNYLGSTKTFLQLVVDLRRQCGVSGADPTTTAGLSGEMLRLANYINEAYMEILNAHDDWEFLKQNIEFLCAAGQQKYTTVEMQIVSHGGYRLNDFTIASVDSDNDEQPLPFMAYDDFKLLYMYGPTRATTNRPCCFTIDGQQNLLLGQTPDVQYRIRGIGYACPTEFSNDSDIPAFPGKYARVIVHKAMMLYGQYEAAPEVYNRGMESFGRSNARLCAEQLPNIEWGGPLE